MSLLSGFWQSADAQQRGRVAGDVLLASAPTASWSVRAESSSSLPCSLHVAQIHEASAASGDSEVQQQQLYAFAWQCWVAAMFAEENTILLSSVKWWGAQGHTEPLFAK